MNITKRTTGIVCTLGPACKHIDTLRKMAQEGMKIARLNLSHETHENHAQRIETLRKLNKEGFDIKILLDLEGYRIRLGKFKDDVPKEIRKGKIVHLSHDPRIAETEIGVPFDYSGSLYDITPGADIYIDDGNILVRAISSTETYIEAEVIVPGLLKSHKGVNIPNIDLEFNLFTDKDRRDVIFGIEHQVDYIAQSFVRNAQDVLNVKELLSEHKFSCDLIAKIENREGINNIEEIIEVADGIMIARGDMGVSIPIYEVPITQKVIMTHCNQAKKMVITATQMLESMTNNLRPTRAEVTDIANAVLDGSDYVMLSGETAIGLYPVEAVKMMRQVIEFTNKNRGKINH